MAYQLFAKCSFDIFKSVIIKYNYKLIGVIMDKNVIVIQVITLFIMMMVGFVARKKAILTPTLNKGLTELLVNITAPFLALASFQFEFSQKMLIEVGIVFLFSAAVHFFSIFIGKIIFRRFPSEKSKVLRFITIFSNCGFMGYPVIGSVYGQQGIFYTSVYVATFTFFLWTYGVYIFSGKADRESVKNAVFNPGVILTVLGLFLFLFSIQLPAPILKAVEGIGGMTTPISMIVIGASLAEIKLVEFFGGFDLYYGVVIRLLIIPLITLLILKWLGFQGILLNVLILLVAMPAAAITVPIAEKQEGDTIFASRLVFISTILSIFTIPMIIWLI